MEISIFALVLPFSWRKPGFVGWNNSETGARPSGFLLFYYTATGSAYLTAQVKLGLARFLSPLPPPLTHLLLLSSAARN